MVVEYIEREAAMPDGFCVGVSCQECSFCDDPVKGGCKVARFIDAIPAADVVERPRWIPVTERLPDIGSNCLIFSVSGWVAEGQFDGDGWTQYRWSAKFDKDAVTHWMPLPEPPKEEA